MSSSCDDSDSSYQDDSEDKKSDSTETEEEVEENDENSNEENSSEEREPFTCIDVNTDDTVVGARGCDITFLSPSGQFKNGYKAKYSNKKIFHPH